MAPFLVGRDLPPVPTLLLAGERDLTTPVAWTQQEAARAPKGRLVVVPGARHITRDVAYGQAGRDAVTPFRTEDRPS
ncbi:MAG: alpha/beta hydrolase [Pseudonocardia sp.]|nr:alpha/beta hydrolase [Pseudonocardia sp.]